MGCNDMAVAERIYQASDLAGTGRREFLDEARAGQARLRDTDGRSLVMLPEADYSFFDRLRTLTADYLALETALTRDAAHRAPSDLGGLAWADSLPESDLGELRRDYADELARATASRDLHALDLALHEWRMAADTWRDPVSRAILEGKVTDEDFVEVDRPTEDG